MGTNLDDVTQDDMKETSEIEAGNDRNQGTVDSGNSKLGFVTNFVY